MSKDGSGSCGSISAVGGASGGSDPPPLGRVALATKSTRSRVRIQDIVPCCVSQLLTSTLFDNVFKIRGIEISQVSIVGIIRQAEKAANCVLYKIDDMTAKPIEVRQRIGRDKAKQGVTLLPVGVYAKVFGILRCSAEVKSLEVLKIRILEDMNEFTTHILETVNAHMVLDKALQAASGQSTPVAPFDMDEAQKHSECHPDFLWKEVLRLIQECPRQEGKSIGELLEELRNLSIGTIKQTINYLTTEGHIYPTVDGEHFKSAN
nr:replication protein A 30 kDa subunit [Camelus bactrianus]